MLGLLRVFVAGLLVLALPVQGFAAVSGGICMGLGHHGDAAAMHDHSAPAGDQDDHAALEHHHDGDSSSGKHAGDGHCAPCVACCAAAAIAAFPPPVFADRSVTPLVPASLAAFHTIEPQRLDRPPLAS